MAAREPPALPDEVVEEILLRVPPDDPARLMRAALACKPWCRLISGHGFRRRFRERHRTPPVLGILRTFFSDREGGAVTRFVPTCSLRPRRTDRRGWRTMDSRHGRVLLCRDPRSSKDLRILSVWNPIEDKVRELPAVLWDPFMSSGGNALVLCAGAAAANDCDHLDCSGEPFLVAFVIIDNGKIFVYIYSSEADAWSEQASAPNLGFHFRRQRGVLAGNALYFVFDGEDTTRFLEYDLGTRELTLVHPPPMSNNHIVVTSMSGGLRAITIEGSKLYMWLREAGTGEDVGWAQREFIEIYTVIPASAILFSYDVVGFADGCGLIYMATDHGSFTADLKSGQVRKLGGVNHGGDNVVPYVSFYTPAPGYGTSSNRKKLKLLMKVL
ncbi:hypothetical protein ACP70R_046333 [Stipagrostis hirtigluma subsp. patula]